ncbi:MAG: NAD-dependent epimerase/dehydratase [uncultured bacterium]|nr:MAG: NAD-dependent epimerase/dehydratase [uncultured bacterium]KKU60068.1 MAG: NAD-dependent epimerase/dehydratase [Microgenomates group bacterium GW2011_GWE1_47_12]HBD02454.1 GDP-mannose 4,6-dehydratase [Candidatus Collierbacteria bacterium]HBO10461.1 GDP-mannose 4,6-dehydratase [Candidatus Collierbacteria bacterium]
MKILITGAGGFVGTYLIRQLQKKTDNEIYGAVYKSTSDISSLLPQNHILEGDLTDFAVAESHLQTVQPDIIYHLAALSVVGNSFANAIKVINTNTNLSFNLFEAARLIVPKARIINICSANVYGAVLDSSRPLTESTPFRPLNPYSVSKINQEMLGLEYHLTYGSDVIALRPFNHTGIGQTTDFLIPRLAQQFAAIEKGQLAPTIEIGNLDSIRDFSDVRDMVSAYVLAAESCLAGEAYNIGSGKGYKVSQVIDIFQSLSQAKVEIKVKKDLVRSADVPALVADFTKFKEATGYFPVISLERTISDILDFYRQQKG